MIKLISYQLLLLLVGHFVQSESSSTGSMRYIREIDSETGTSAATPQQQVDTLQVPASSTPITTVDDLAAIKEQKDAEILEIIRQGLERLRDAEKRLRKFVNKIEDGIKSGVLNETIEKVKTKIETGKLDLHKFVADLKEKKSLGLLDLIKRISDDSYSLLDKLHGRIEPVTRIIGLKSNVSDEDKSQEPPKNIQNENIQYPQQ